MAQDAWSLIAELPADSSPEVTIEVFDENGNLSEALKCPEVERRERTVCSAGRLTLITTRFYRCPDGKEYRTTKQTAIGSC